jgi:hypothetical protein
MTRLATALASTLALAAVAQEAKPKLAVMPFAALTGDVPPRAGSKALGMLLTEFKSADAFTLVEAKKEKENTFTEESLETARKEVEAAKGHRAKKKFRLAEEALLRAVFAYKVATPLLTEIGEVVDAYALLAAVQYNTGRDDEGARSLNQALALAPDRELPLAQTSALFARVVADARKALKDGPKGVVVLESSPANAPVQLDGQALGSAPLTVRDVPPGLHFWRATLPSGEVVGGVVEVAAGKQAQVKAASASKDPDTRLLSALAQNKLDADALAAAKETAKAAEADLVVFGALSREGKGLTLDTFLYAAATGELRRMARASFDTELLSAGMEFYSLAGELAKKGDKAGEPARVPAQVSLTLVPTAAARMAEAKFGVLPGQEAGDVESVEASAEPKEAGDGKRKPLEQKRRAPLKRN